jgi:putative copper resistance protein D
MAGRWAVYPPLLLVCGVSGMRLLEAMGPRDLAVRDLRAELARLALLSSLLLLAALLLRAVFQSIEVWGAGDALALDNLRAVALESRWGGRWRWQAAAAIVAILGSVTVYRLPAVGLTISGAGALGLAATLPMTGHAFGIPVAWTAQSIHVLGAGFWIGTLTVILALPLTVPGISVAEAASMRRFWLSIFWPLAMVAATLLVLSGMVLAVLYLPAWDSLWTEPYGRILLAKMAGSVCVLFLGAVNHLRMNFRPDPHAAPVPLTVGLEVVFAVVVLAATGMLTSTAQPHAP